MDKYYIIIGIVVVLALLIGIRFYLKNVKAPTNNKVKSGLDINLLLSYIGTKSNITSVSSTMSKVDLVLKDSSVIDVEGIKAMGATGIVQNQNKVSIIFGKLSETIAKEIEQA